MYFTQFPVNREVFQSAYWEQVLFPGLCEFSHSYCNPFPQSWQFPPMDHSLALPWTPGRDLPQFSSYLLLFFPVSQLHPFSSALADSSPHPGLGILSGQEAGTSLASPFCVLSLKDHWPSLSYDQCLGLGTLLLSLSFLSHKRCIILIAISPTRVAVH